MSLIDHRQIDLTDVLPDIHPGDLKQLIFTAALRGFGEHDEMRIVSVEEVIAEEAPHVPTP